MNVAAIGEAINQQLQALLAAGKEPCYIRMTCEQLDYIKSTFHESEFRQDPLKPIQWRGFTVVTRGSIMDCNYREAKPKLCHIDLTKVE